VTDLAETEVCQLPSHAEIVAAPETPAIVLCQGHGPDAIVVPASRPAEHLTAAIDAAKQVGCDLVVLCSYRTDPAELEKLFDEKSLITGTAVTVPWTYERPLFDFETTRWTREGDGKRVCAVRNSDLSIKRNIGLAIARMVGWNRIFFMDDDIRDISTDAIVGTVSMLGTEGPGGRYQSAGMAIKEFPDNSVVCHGRRKVGERQDVFVSGSVLAVDTSARFDFFPDIYNEDWLFFYRNAAGERLASSGFTARQLPYDPFADPLRAAGQEFGDVIAEGLYALLHSRLGTESADRDYWRMFLEDRNRIIDEILGNLDAATPGIRQEMSTALAAARETLREISPDMCVQYIEAWQADLEQWGKRLQTLPSTGTVEKALCELELR
jgi:hypothetical protein